MLGSRIGSLVCCLGLCLVACDEGTEGNALEGLVAGGSVASGPTLSGTGSLVRARHDTPLLPRRRMAVRKGDEPNRAHLERCNESPAGRGSEGEVLNGWLVRAVTAKTINYVFD